MSSANAAEPLYAAISNTAGAALAGALATGVFGAEWFVGFSAVDLDQHVG